MQEIALLATLVLAVFGKIDLAELEHEGISYEGIGYLMLTANVAVPGVSLTAGLFQVTEETIETEADSVNAAKKNTADPMGIFENPIMSAEDDETNEDELEKDVSATSTIT